MFSAQRLDAEETDPYFDVQEYVETVFRKQLKLSDPLNEELTQLKVSLIYQ